MDKLKVSVYFDDPYSYGGEQRVVALILNQLCRLYDITLISALKKPAEFPYPLNPAIRTECVPHKHLGKGERWLRRKLIKINSRTNLFNNRIAGKLYVKVLEDKKQFKRIAEMLTAGKTDVLIGISGRSCPVLYRAAKAGICKTVAWMHNSYEAYFETENMYCWHQDHLFRAMLSKIDECVVLNEDIARKYMKNLGAECRVIYNPRSFVSAEKAELKNKQFIASGRMVYSKGFDLLLESFRSFCKSNSDWTLVILGDGPLRATIVKKAIEYGIFNRVRFTGFVKDVKPFMLSSSVFLLPSRWEGFSMVVTEALELGLPIVSYNIPAMLPVVTDGKEGILIDPFDTEKFAAAMLRMAESEDLRRRMGNSGIEKAQQFSIEKISGDWITLLNKYRKDAPDNDRGPADKPC